MRRFWYNNNMDSQEHNIYFEQGFGKEHYPFPQFVDGLRNTSTIVAIIGWAKMEATYRFTKK